MDVRDTPLRLSAGAGGAHDGAFCDRLALGDADRPEMRQRDREAVRGEDREGHAVRGNVSGERHRPGRGRQDGLGALARDVDPSMLSGRKGIAHGRERPEHGAVERPGPGACDRREHKRHHPGDGARQPTHGSFSFVEHISITSLVLSIDNREASWWLGCCPLRIRREPRPGLVEPERPVSDPRPARDSHDRRRRRSTAGTAHSEVRR
jgi:hypothetical protein